jgi:hypothetical protein
MLLFKWFADVWMVMRECAAPPAMRRREMQEAVVADLHTCMEQLETRMVDMETKITRCGEQAIYHMQQSKKGTAPSRLRDRMRAKTHMEERRRQQKQLDKANLMHHAIQKQIDDILSSHMDMLIVDAMRGFNYAATSMVLPQRLNEVEQLSDQLADRQNEVNAMQEAIMGIGNMDGGGMMIDDESDLWQELDTLMHDPDVDVVTSGIAAAATDAATATDAAAATAAATAATAATDTAAAAAAAAAADTAAAAAAADTAAAAAAADTAAAAVVADTAAAVDTASAAAYTAAVAVAESMPIAV